VFIQKGEPWRIIDSEDNKIFVVREESPTGAIPSWEGELMPVHHDVAQEAGKIRKKKLKVFPDDQKILIEKFGDHVIIHACFGSKTNATIGRVMTALLSTELGSSVGLNVDPYRIIIRVPTAKDTDLVIKKFLELKPEWVKPILTQSLKNSTMFLWRFGHVAQRFGIIKKGSSMTKRWLEKLIDVYDQTPLVKEAMNEVLNDKMDVEKAEQAIKNMRKGSTEIKVSKDKEVSQLGVEALMKTSMKEFMKPREAFQEVLNIVDKRLIETRFSFTCTNCGTTLGSYRVRSIPENMKCHSCGARTLGFVNWFWDRDKLKVFKKKMRGEKLDKNEEKTVKNVLISADLFIAFGGLACYVMAGRGVGPRTAKRLLSKPYAEKKDLLRRIIEAEKNFLKTKKYWKT
ncbi:MAG: hypothetical protein GOU97_00005, partial [Nanoarchaeota archaeon]|nr:hypothetical protein [Nanoarchaeota archaeon]